MAVDSSLNRLLLYGPDGKGSLLTDKTLPALVARSGNRILLKLVGRDVLSLDANGLNPETIEGSQINPILQKVKTPVGPLTAVYQWAGIDQSLLAVGLVLDKKLSEGFQAGLFRFSASDGEKEAELLLRVNAWDYYVLGYDYVTSTPTGGGTGYFLDMDNGFARLFEVPPGGAAHELPGAVPAEVREAPHIDATMYGPKDVPPLFTKLAQLKMATGIYGGPDGNVYLLGREPTPKEGNLWWLFRISPKGVVLGKARLPTHAKHLSIVVSPDTFYLIERGDAFPQGNQQIDTMVAVPASVLEHAPLKGIEVCPGR